MDAQVLHRRPGELARQRFKRVFIDFDGSVISTAGHAEGSAVGFNKTRKGEPSSA